MEWSEFDVLIYHLCFSAEPEETDRNEKQVC